MASRSTTVDRVSFNSPGDASPWPASILLAEGAYTAASRNDTTASARSRDNHTVEVTFWIADPPAVSFYTFHCIEAPNSDSDFDFDVDDSDQDYDLLLEFQPHVVAVQGRFVLLRTQFVTGDDEYEYFVYKGHPEAPSLESVPRPDGGDRSLRGLEFGIVPRGDDGHYLLAALGRVRKNGYRLHIYSSEDAAWRTKELPNPCPEVDTILPDKVFLLRLRDGVLLWVDFLRGMLVCDVLQEPLHARYIPLPEPLPRNRQRVKQCHPGTTHFRDLTCADGRITFVEMEHRVIVRETTDVPPEKPFDPRTKDVLCDSDLIRLTKRKPVENKPKRERGWSAITWTREIGSTCWRKGSIVDVDDIMVDDSVLPALLSYQRRESAESMTFKNLHSAWPTLSTYGNDILYLKSFMEHGELVPVAVDLVEKTLKVVAREEHPFGKDLPAHQMFLPCTLSNYLKMTPGNKVSASQIAPTVLSSNRTCGKSLVIPSEEKIVLTGSFANETNNTAVRVGEPDSYEAEKKRPRLSAEKVNHTQIGAQSTVHNVLITQAHPNQNNMHQQPCFNRWEQPGYGYGYYGYSSWPHQNNPNVPLQPPPPQCFNNLAEPCNPVYAPLVPTTGIHSYGNYQPPWQQPLLLEQQMAHRRTFEPHQAPQQWFNNWCEARYHGNSQQHPAGNSYSYGPYGGHSGSGNYHQH